MSIAEASRDRRTSWVLLTTVLFFAIVFVMPHLFESWTPADEGVLAQSAERVMRGELPHRDFVALWSGGLDAVHALAFRISGVTLSTMRDVLLVGWLVGLTAMFAAARAVLPPFAAAALVLVAVGWTIPISPHPLPSWHTLFLSLVAVLAVVRALQSRRMRWMVAAGAAAAAACVVKITGLYVIAAIALALVWAVQEETPPDAIRLNPARLYPWVITSGLLGFVALVALTFAGVASGNAAVHYLVPSIAVVALLLWREWRRPADADLARFGRLAAYVVPFVAGTACIFGPWLGYYAVLHSLGDLLTGLFVTPRVRFSVATYALPGLRSAAVSALPFALLLVGAPFVRRPLGRRDRALWWMLIAGLCALSYDGSPTVLVVWYGFRLMTPIVAVIAIWWLSSSDPRIAIPADRRSVTFLLVAAAVTGSLVQIPFALYTYFLYFVPMLLLAMAAVFTSPTAMPREVPTGLMLFLLWFGIRHPDSLALPVNPERDRLATLAMPRGGLIVSQEDSAQYAALVQAIDRHAAGEFIYVWHDSPQVYFLAAKKNPTRTMFEVFDDSVARSTSYLVDRLQRTDVRLVVLTDPAGAARPLAPDFRAWIDSTYPLAEQVGRAQVRWRVAVQR